MPIPHAMIPQDLTRIRFVSDPQISPDGRTVAFVVTTLSEEKDEYLSNIWTVSTAGGEPRRFTTGPRRDTRPRWSPDGSRLAFISEREPGQKGQLHVMPAAGGESVRLTDLRHGLGAPEWSPDGTRLAFSSDRAGNYDIWTLMLASGDLRRLTTNSANDSMPAWSPNGSEIAFVSDRAEKGIYARAVDGSAERLVVADATAIAGPIWTPRR